MNFEKITIRKKITSRGGGIEIDLTSLGYPGEKMTAYQNYLGGGMLGAVCSDCTVHHKYKFIEESMASDLDRISTQLKAYFHSLTNPVDCWESTSFEQNQSLPVSAY